MATTYNHPPSPPNPNHLDDIPEALQIYEIEGLRQDQESRVLQELLQRKIAKGGDLDAGERAQARQDVVAEFDDLIKLHLESKGVMDTDPEFARYASKLRDLSIDKISVGDWAVAQSDPSDPSKVLDSPRAAVIKDLESNYAVPSISVPPTPPLAPPPPAPAHPPIPPAPPAPSTASAINPTLQSTADDARKKFIEATAKRQGGVNFFRRSKRQAEYQDLQESYHLSLRDQVANEVAFERGSGNYANEDEARLDAASRLLKGYEDLQRGVREVHEESYKGRFIAYMNKGGVAKRIVKGVVLGGAAAVVAGTATALSGGMVGLVAGGAAVAGARFARNYARFDRTYNGPDIANASDPSRRVDVIARSGTESMGADAAITRIHEQLMEDLNKENSSEISKRRKAAGLAMAMTAIPAGLGAVLTYASDLVPSTNGFMSRLPGFADSGDSPSGDPSQTPDKPAGSGGPDGSEKEPTSPKGPDAEQQPTEPGAKEPGAPEGQPASPEVHEYSDAARTIKPGEGFYQTFEDMDIPPEDRAELLEKVGPKLHDLKVDGQPLAFKMDNGEWGIRMTPDGKMPQAALDTISDTHDQMSGADGATAGGAEVTTSSPADEVAPKPGAQTAAETLNQTAIKPVELGSWIGDANITLADVEGSAAMEKLLHVSPGGSPEVMAQQLNLPASEWLRVQEYIIDEVNQGNRLYTDAFMVNANGYLSFSGNTIPANTMAGILNQISPSVRSNLALAA